MDEPALTVVFLRGGGIVLSKKPYGDWREAQAEFPDFMTSLGPWSPDEVAEWLADEYPTMPSCVEEIRTFMRSDRATLVL